ncbi:hypothetical protein GWK47_036938 [Chionoecetes opilio]|uniref:Uncharacterized protein n=1 Tax=Chionoecetes opilio TaxID=41210 RepID=A0A8J4YFF8_CHIOP|nr:hypothetical protein GWK47_036938 [Chionoecetes opilio]
MNVVEALPPNRGIFASVNDTAERGAGAHLVLQPPADKDGGTAPSSLQSCGGHRHQQTGTSKASLPRPSGNNEWQQGALNLAVSASEIPRNDEDSGLEQHQHLSTELRG